MIIIPFYKDEEMFIHLLKKCCVEFGGIQLWVDYGGQRHNQEEEDPHVAQWTFRHFWQTPQLEYIMKHVKYSFLEISERFSRVAYELQTRTD